MKYQSKPLSAHLWVAGYIAENQQLFGISGQLKRKVGEQASTTNNCYVADRGNSMKGLFYGLTARNSSQDMRLFVDLDEDSSQVNLTLTGKHDGQDIQIDFDPLTKDEAQTLADHIRERTKVLR